MSKEQVAFWTVGGRLNSLESKATLSQENIFLLNDQVANLERGQIGASYHRNANQTITAVGSPSTVSIAWTDLSAWSDTTAITKNLNNTQFTVNISGVYNLNLNIQYNNISNATLTDRTFRIAIALSRGGNISSIIIGDYDFANNTPNTVGVSCGGVFELQAGDILTLNTTQYLSAGSFSVLGQSASPTNFDLNTFWSWTLINPL